ncbi:hypothetical protein CSIRO_2395 [Bradyrhizobiaceae bacterium SG-6C]|nr:hypothetical protein CSIRO_2395 [Bradyrhizobiaceae bacterium SG-6C]
MTLALLRERFFASVNWCATQVSARPKTVLAIWFASLVLAAWVF